MQRPLRDDPIMDRVYRAAARAQQQRMNWYQAKRYAIPTMPVHRRGATYRRQEPYEMTFNTMVRDIRREVRRGKPYAPIQRRELSTPSAHNPALQQKATKQQLLKTLKKAQIQAMQARGGRTR